MLSKERSTVEVIFYIYYEDLSVLSPYLYAIRTWRKHGYDVSVFSLHDEKRSGSIPTSIRKDSVHHFVAFPFFLKLLCKSILALGAIPRIAGLRARGGRYAGLVEKVYFALYCYLKTDKRKRSILIAADPPGLWAASLVSKRTKNRIRVKGARKPALPPHIWSATASAPQDMGVH